MSVCGSGSDHIIAAPPKGWHSAANALWKVRKPLDVFHLEHTNRWEIGVMGELSTRMLILANLSGSHFLRAFQDDPDYFPELQTIMIEPRERRVGQDTRQFSRRDFDILQEMCENRSVTIVEGANPTSRHPDHCWFEYDNL